MYFGKIIQFNSFIFHNDLDQAMCLGIKAGTTYIF